MFDSDGPIPLPVGQYMTTAHRTGLQVAPSLLSSKILALGVRVSVTAPASHRDDFVRLLRPWQELADAPKEVTPHSSDELVIHLALDANSDLEKWGVTLSSAVTQTALTHLGGHRLLLHAAGLARDDGAAAVIVGPSGRGKTTTARFLAKHLGYVSDEAICVDADAAIEPYRKPLSVITPNHFYKLQISAAELGLRALPEVPLHAASLIILERGTRPESFVEPVPLAEGILDLVEQSSFLAAMQAPLQEIATLATRTGGIRRLVAGTPESLHAVIDDLFAPVKAPTWEAVLPRTPSYTCASPITPAFCASQPGSSNEILDAVECADGTVLLTRNHQVLHLQGVGPVLWRGICEGENWDQLAARVEAEHGCPEGRDTRSAIELAAVSLIDAGIVQPGTP